MAIKNNHPRFDSGSVLTEFLLVAPLYLLLFGFLMLSNDLLRVKNKILMLDDFVTVTGTHRFMRESGDSITKHVNRIWGDFLPKSVNVPLMIANEYENSQGKQLVNGWNAVYAGRVDVEYKLPSIFNSMLSVQRVVFGDKDTPAPPQSFRFYANPQTGEFPSENDCRFHVIQRYWSRGTGDKKLNRGVYARVLVQGGIMANVLEDSWLFADQVKSTSTSTGEDESKPYEQMLLNYAQ